MKPVQIVISILLLVAVGCKTTQKTLTKSDTEASFNSSETLNKDSTGMVLETENTTVTEKSDTLIDVAGETIKGTSPIDSLKAGRPLIVIGDGIVFSTFLANGQVTTTAVKLPQKIPVGKQKTTTTNKGKLTTATGSTKSDKKAAGSYNSKSTQRAKEASVDVWASIQAVLYPALILIGILYIVLCVRKKALLPF